MKNYSVKNIEAVLNEVKEFGVCFIGNMYNGTLTIKGLNKIEKFLKNNKLTDEYFILCGNEFDGYIDGDMYMAYAK